MGYSVKDTVILHDVSLKVHGGQLITLIGPNGSGKSTLLKILLGLIKPTTGTVHRHNTVKIGYVPQKFFLNPAIPLTVRAFFKNALGDHFSLQRAVVSDLLKDFRIDTLLDRPMIHLSGGELQKVLLTRAILREPNLLILDEPTQGMDVYTQNIFYKKINECCKSLKWGVLLVSHDLHFVHSTDYVICLNKHICCAGQPHEMIHNSIYQELFAIPMMALYTHHHDHSHD